MANEIQEQLRMAGGSIANSSAAARWAQALARAVDAGTGTFPEVVELLRAAGIPLGSAFGQWAMRVSLDVSLVTPSGASVEMLRPVAGEYQKPPAGESRFAQVLSGNLLFSRIS